VRPSLKLKVIDSLADRPALRPTFSAAGDQAARVRSRIKSEIDEESTSQGGFVLNRTMTATIAAGIVGLCLTPAIWAHCEIPCGIYDDAARYDLLEEHITTIEKAMTQIAELSAAGDKNYNQLVRWIVNKEEHAVQFQEIVWQYFLTQRIKPVPADAGEEYQTYLRHLQLYHEMLAYAMKCKQTTDKANVEKLKELVKESRELYFKP
jgi:nickel superoxide dismutase